MGGAGSRTFASAFDASRGRGRGLVRGEHSGLHGRSVSAASVASTSMSESETMVHEQLDIIEAVEPEDFELPGEVQVEFVGQY